MPSKACASSAVEGVPKAKRLSERSMGSSDNPWSGDEAEPPKVGPKSKNGTSCAESLNSVPRTPSPKGSFADVFD